jgi:ATP-dependent DNA helicase RecG
MNALIHRNYFIKGPIKIAIYDDRLEVFSPRVFPGPIQIDHLNVGVTYIRNSVITRAFREMGHIEKLGSGFLVLFSSYRKMNLPEPLVHEGVGFVKCILPRPGRIQEVLGEEQKILQLLMLKNEIKAHDVISQLSVSRATANRYLKVLLEKNLIRKFGHGPSTYYRRSG